MLVIDSLEHVPAFVTVTVTSPVCGNVIVEGPQETCDDGNTVSGDGCSATCQVEAACRPLGATCETTSQCCTGFCQSKSHTCILG